MNSAICFERATHFHQLFTLESENRGEVTSEVVWAALQYSQIAALVEHSVVLMT